MTDLLASLRKRIETAVRTAFGDEAASQDPAIRRSAHSDFQADVAMGLARKVKQKPREVADAIAKELKLDDVIAEVVVSGPGFINLKVNAERLAGDLGSMLADDRLGVPMTKTPERVVVDYSSPNIAKDMHVGHLRSTILGDAVARLLSFLGHDVVRQNHVGDWGTPFGMLLEHMLDNEQADSAGTNLRDLGEFYRAARAKFDSDPAFAERSRKRVVSLQGGDEATLTLWKRLINLSVAQFTRLYARLGVTLLPEHVAGESKYNAALTSVIAELEEKGLARESQGALCVFPPGFAGRDGEPVPLIVRKQDGGYGYATTDLAALRYRTQELKATRLLYFVGSPQAQHFAMVFAAGKLAGWIGPTVRVEHVSFGSVLGPDKKMFKTRAGDTISLDALMDEAVERASKSVREKSPELDADTQARIASAVGIGAIKYADLSNDRIKDYVFDWNRMLAFEGNTAPYLMYAHARIRSILRKAGDTKTRADMIRIEAPEERSLALALLQWNATLEKTAESLEPHRVCVFLYELASAFTSFYEKCPVLKADEPTRSSRLALADLTARVLMQGLGLLGIEAPEKM